VPKPKIGPKAKPSDARAVRFSKPRRALFGAITGFGTQGRQARRTKLLTRLNMLKGNTEKEWCKTAKKQTVEDRVMSFEWGSCT
jgi:hypothetical protein